MAASKQRYRPRAPSPKHSEFDSDNTYSLVQDSMRDRKMTQVARIDRMFGDSANEDNDRDKKPNVHRGSSKFGSVSSNSTNSSSLRGGGEGSLASLYQARKQGHINGGKSAHGTSSIPHHGGGRKEGHYDAATVEQIKKQFQAQIEAMMLSQVRMIWFTFSVSGVKCHCKTSSSVFHIQHFCKRKKPLQNCHNCNLHAKNLQNSSTKMQIVTLLCHNLPSFFLSFILRELQSMHTMRQTCCFPNREIQYFANHLHNCKLHISYTSIAKR